MLWSWSVDPCRVVWRNTQPSAPSHAHIKRVCVLEATLLPSPLSLGSTWWFLALQGCSWAEAQYSTHTAGTEPSLHDTLCIRKQQEPPSLRACRLAYNFLFRDHSIESRGALCTHRFTYVCLSPN